MNWLKDYRYIIHAEAQPLLDAGFSFLGEDDSAMKFMDRSVSVTFSVERYSDALSVLVKFLSDAQPDDELYALDIIMTIFYGRDVADLLEIKTPQDRVRVVRGYVRFLVEQKENLFAVVFPLSQAYRDYIAAAAVRVQAMFAQSAQDGLEPL